jgi:NADH-quinone oxidoreductase subunit A
MFKFEYTQIFFYIIILFCLLLILILFNIFFILKDNYSEKLTAYECGFQAFEYSISTFDVKYYIIAVLFLLFDLELIFFIPFLVSVNFIYIYGIFTMLFFFILLIIGFMYEWKLNILDFNDIFQFEKEIKYIKK